MPSRYAAPRFPPLPRNPTHVPPPILWDRNAHDAAYGASCENFRLPKRPGCDMILIRSLLPAYGTQIPRDRLPDGPGAGRLEYPASGMPLRLDGDAFCPAY